MSVLLPTDYVTLVQMNTARTEHACRQMRPLATDYGDDRLERLIDACIEAAREVAGLASRRRGQTKARSDDDDEFDKIADAEMRRLIKSLNDSNEWMQRTRHPQRARLRTLVMTHCPVGPGDIISQRYEEQLHRTRALIEDLRGPCADLIEELECERKLRAVEATVAPYEAALTARRRVTGGDVRAAAKVMHTRTCEMVAYIVGAYVDRPDRRRALLLPVADQQARIREILKARRAGQSVGDDPSRDDDDLLDAEGVEEAEGAEGAEESAGAEEAAADAGGEVAGEG